jgi:hypothetical protein
VTHQPPSAPPSWVLAAQTKTGPCISDADFYHNAQQLSTYYATRRSTTNSLHTPTLAAYTQLNGAFDFNKTPQLEQESSSMRSPACAKPGHHMVLMAGTSDQHQSTTGATNSTAPKQGMNASQTPYNSFHLTSRCHKCPPPMLP